MHWGGFLNSLYAQDGEFVHNIMFVTGVYGGYGGLCVELVSLCMSEFMAACDSFCVTV